jgi:hypothetical protein
MRKKEAKKALCKLMFVLLLGIGSFSISVSGQPISCRQACLNGQSQCNDSCDILPNGLERVICLGLCSVHLPWFMLSAVYSL